MRGFHINSWMNPNNRFDEGLLKNGVCFSFSYDTLLVEEKIETLVYDIGSFLASAGGNLGLFLGFSCLSVLIAAVEALQKFLKS